MLTKKEEILQSINSNCDENHILEIHSILQGSLRKCHLKLAVNKEKTIDVITNNFSDTLIGSMPGDSIIHEIYGWEICER